MFNSVNSLITNFSFSQSQPPQSTSTEYIQRINNPKQYINPPSDKSISDLQTKKKIHECTVCHISFTRKNNLTAHTKESHTNKGKKLNECAVCHISFTRKNNLTKHLLIHTGERPYKCTVCPKAFALSDTLKKHLHIHIGKKPHECIFCDSAFIQKSDLTRHLRIHTGERPYKCTVCPKAFALLGTLKTHVLIHTRIKPHKCKVCPKAFIQKHHLKKHEKAKHANRNIISNHLQQDNLTIEKQIEEVINSCHSEKKITALNDIYEIISLACMKRRISIEKTLLDIFNALSKKHISKNDADSIASKLRVVFKKLPEKIKFENTSFLKNICNDETGYINSLLKLKERDVDEIIQEAFKAEYAVAKHDAIRDVNYSQAIELDDTTAPTREKPANNKRPPDNDYDTLNYKKPRNN